MPAICSVPGCGRIHLARGFCQAHYSRWYKSGDIGEALPVRRPMTFEERFWSKVAISDPDSCWPWLAYRNPDGYGQFMTGSRRDGTRRLRLSHDVAYELAVGPIPKGLEPDHLCRNPPCCNPSHLEPVTRRVNTLRGNAPKMMWIARAALALVRKARTHCKRGHPFTALPNGQRMCLTCAAAAKRRYELKKKAAST